MIELPVAILLLVAGVAGVTPARDSSRCVTDSAAQGTFKFAHNLMTSVDSFPASVRADHRLPRVAAAELVVVGDGDTCSAAATAYSNRHRAEYPDPLANRLAVVKAGRYYFVEVIDPPTEDSEIWEIVVFTHEWKRVISFGGGS